MDLDPVVLALIAIGGVLAAALGYGFGRVYFLILIATRTHVAGKAGWVLVGLLALLAFLIGLLLVAAPAISMQWLFQLDRASFRMPAAQFMTIASAHLLPFLWAADRARRRYETRLNALGLRFG